MTWQAFFEQYINMEPGILSIALRLLCAMIVGALIGLEREYTHRPAGLRTHILVALGACVVSILGEMLFSHYSALGATPDPARLSAQVITGVGFLGAGTIMKEGANVKGLTTAASVWSVACLGIAAGFGYYILALLGTVFIFITLTIVEALQHRFIHAGGSEVCYSLQAEDISAVLTGINAIAQSEKVLLADLSARKLDSSYEITFRAVFFGRRHKRHHDRFFTALIAIPGVCRVSNAEEKATAS